MGWDRKRRGPAAGYFYESVRVPGAAYPVKVYRGRRAAGQLAAGPRGSWPPQRSSFENNPTIRQLDA